MLHPSVGGNDEESRDHEPSQTNNTETQWPFCPSRFSPKSIKPRKLDSRKKENIPSMASVWPITPPAVRENAAQFVPNWNSMGTPVTTPRAKLRAKMRAQKRTARL